MKKLLVTPVLLGALVAACSSSAATPLDTSAVLGATPTAQVTAMASTAGSPATSSDTVVTASTSAGTVLVAGSNGMTVYTYTNDVANSGASTCTGGCLTKWPALTVPAGTTPTAGSGISGKLGTITRTDDGTLQVTYNGLPLYFYEGDHAPGDTNGSYPNWNLVMP